MSLLGIIGKFIYLLGLIPLWPMYIFFNWEALSEKNCHYNYWEEIGRVSTLVSLIIIQLAWGWLLFSIVFDYFK